VGSVVFGVASGFLTVTLLGTSACVQQPPSATVRLGSAFAQSGQAVLVLPTVCEGQRAGLTDCSPQSFVTKEASAQLRLKASFADYVDPVLRLKLEFAGFTLAEASAMRLVSANRVDTESRLERGGVPEIRGESTISAAKTVATLPLAEVRTVAASLGLAGVVTSQFVLDRPGIGQLRSELVVSLLDVETNRERWSVRCAESWEDVELTPERLANCAGNGVLAAFAPGNLIGQVL
jgi:hypothetical protein